MKATVIYSVGHKEETIDLADYGHDESVRFEDLTQEEQVIICDELRDQNYIAVSITTIS